MAKIEIPKMPSILEDGIQLELNIGELYKLFSVYFPEDKVFWANLSMEEKKHANILEGLKPWIAMGVDKEKYILSDPLELKNKLIALKKIIQEAIANPPSRETAFNLAYKIELTASEIHFQKKMSQEADNKLLKAMQELCGADKDHQRRIRKMMDTLGIQLLHND